MKLLKVIVNAHFIKIIEEEKVNKKIINEGEYNIQSIYFEFSEEYTEDLVKVALFTKNNKTYKMIIENNQCNIPSEVMTTGDCLLGVYAYKTEDAELILRYSPTPKYFLVELGSYKENAVNSKEITPSEMEQYTQILNNSLSTVKEELNKVIETGKKASEQGDYAKEQGDYAKEQGDYAKSASDTLNEEAEEGKFNGKSIEFKWDGTRLGIRLQGEVEYTFVDLQGMQGPIGPQGEAFSIKKTYSSKEAMDLDFDNMQIGDYVMIASNVNEEDNAKLYTRTESDNNWVFIADFSGAIGIQGPVGKTPKLMIGTVTSLDPDKDATVNITGTAEEPTLNFGLPQGKQGAKPVVGVDYFTEEDKQNMVNSITEDANSEFNQNVINKTEEFNTNAEEKVEEFNNSVDSLKEYIDDLYNNQIVGTAEGNNIYLEDSAEAKLKSIEIEGNLLQKTTVGYQSIDDSSLRNTLVDFNGGKLLVSTNKFNIKPGVNFIKWIFEDGTNVAGTSTLDNIRFYSGNTIIKQFGGNTNFTQEEIDQFERVEIRTTVTFANNYNGKTIKAFLFTNDENVFNEQLNNVEEYTGGLSSPSISYPQIVNTIDRNLIIKINNEEKENICVINLKNNILAKTNYAIDKLKIINNHAYIEKNIEKEKLVSTSKWNKLPETDTYYEYATQSAKVSKKCQNPIKLSTHFGKENNNKLVVAGNDQQTIYVRIPKNIGLDVSTLELWKAFLDENEVYFYYELVDAEIIDLGIIEMPKTHKNITNISLIANLDTNMTVEYIKDTETVVNNLQQQIDDIKNLLSTTETSAFLLDNLEKEKLEEI